MKIAVALMTLLLCAACRPIHFHGDEEASHGGSTVNRSIRVAEGTKMTGDASSVNGSIRIEAHCTAQKLSTVNGSVRIGAECLIQGDVSTVNGRVVCGDGTRVQGDISTVNGRIELDKTQVSRGLTTVNGDITLNGGRVGGDIVIKGRHSGWGNPSTVVITLQQGAEVAGDIRVEDDSRRVEVRQSGNATIRGKVVGAQVIKE